MKGWLVFPRTLDMYYGLQVVQFEVLIIFFAIGAPVFSKSTISVLSVLPLSLPSHFPLFLALWLLAPPPLKVEV